VIYVIALDLESPESRSAAVGDWMQRYFPNHRQIMPQLWIGEGALAADQIRTGLDPLLGENDRLVVIKAAREAVTRGFSEDEARWVAESFPDSLTERIPSP
jgi:hypothetical protein